MILESLGRHAGWIGARICTCIWMFLLPPAAFAAGFKPDVEFNLRCSGCHGVGTGDVVGPDLRGVTERRDAKWLHAFIRSSQSVIRRGDKTAVALFEKYQKRMPDHDLTDGQIDALLGFIAAGGPQRPAGEYRRASTATAVEVARGRRLFTGQAALTRGGAACVRCHAAGGAAGWRGGTLASDLTRVYLKYRDGGLTRAISESRLPLMALYRDRPLTAEETFAIKAFLYRAAGLPAVARQLARTAAGRSGTESPLSLTRLSLGQ